MAASLCQLLVILIGQKRTVYVGRLLPSERMVQTGILRSGRQILVTSHNVGNAHQMVIYYVRKVIGRETVGLNQNHVVKLFILNGNLTVNCIGKACGALKRGVLTDYERLACCKVRLNLFLRKIQTMLVVLGDYLALVTVLILGYHTLQGVQTLSVTEAVICLTLLHKLLCILHVDTGLHTLTLYIRSKALILIRTLIV